MPRGVVSKDGDTNVSKNGYHYTKVEGRFRLTHHIIAETLLGRPLEVDETVSFHDGDRTNLTPSNVKITRRKTNYRGRIATLDDKIREYTAERDRLQELLDKQEANKLRLAKRQEQT